jgi:type I restriction enzyme, S subunit
MDRSHAGQGRRTTDFADATDMKPKSTSSAVHSPAPTGRRKLAQGKERSDAALGHAPQNTPSPEGAKELGELPKGWRWVTLRGIADIAGGVTKGQKRRPNETVRRVPYLRVANVQRGYLDLTEVKEIDATGGEIEALRLRVGDILFNEGGDRDKLGRGWVWNGELPECVHQNHVFRARVRNSEDNPKFISYYGNSAGQSYFYDQGKHTTNLASINLTKLGALPIPLPAPDEQRRIVAEIEKQFTRLDAGVAALRRVQANLKRYRAAVLKAACEGRLVPTEAELHRQRVGRVPSPNVGSLKAKGKAASTETISTDTPFETGEALLARILAERRKNWKGRGLYKEPAGLETANLFELPAGWTWTTLDALAEIKGGITKDQNRKHCAPTRLVPYLRVANVQRGYIDLSEVREIETTEDEIQELALKSGDILFNEGGDRDKLGRGWVWNCELLECIHQNHVFRARLFDAAMNPKLVSWYANTFGQKFFFDEGKHTTNLASISMSKLKALPVPVPPPSEQTRIVAEVERRLSVVDELESVVTANLQRTTRLRQSILQKAFSGELNAGDKIE